MELWKWHEQRLFQNSLEYSHRALSLPSIIWQLAIVPIALLIYTQQEWARFEFCIHYSVDLTFGLQRKKYIEFRS